MIKNLNKIICFATLLCSSISTTYSENLLVGYLDTTAIGSALKVNMQQAREDGYNMTIFGFAKITGTEISFYDATSESVFQQKLIEATDNGMKVLVSVGGQVNTFNPGDLNDSQLFELATHIVDFLQKNHLDGIDFDIEVQTNPNLLMHLLQNIRSLNENIILTAAPQINQGKLVTTGENQDYKKAIDAGLFDYLFLQAYNTPWENDSHFISTIYPIVKSQLPSHTKILIGEPTAAVAAGVVSIYHPSPDVTFTTEQVTEKMLSELKAIHSDSQFAGVMGWSLNVDYDATDYQDPLHTPGSYAYGLKDCVLNLQCDAPPAPKPPISNYILQTSNTDSASGIGMILTITDNQGHQFTSDYIAPNSNKIYNALSNPSASPIEGIHNLIVHWVTYPGGPSGDCPGYFDLTKNMNIMVNPSFRTCDFKAL